MSLHSRRASGEVLDALHACPGAGTPILHWFSGPLRDLDRAIELGCWFSVGPAMLRGFKGRQLAARMPIDRVLIESDGPFAQVDGRAAWPWEAVTAIPDLAKLWRIGEGDCERQRMANLAAIGKIAVSPQFQ